MYSHNNNSTVNLQNEIIYVFHFLPEHLYGDGFRSCFSHSSIGEITRNSRPFLPTCSSDTHPMWATQLGERSSSYCNSGLMVSKCKAQMSKCILGNLDLALREIAYSDRNAHQRYYCHRFNFMKLRRSDTLRRWLERRDPKTYDSLLPSTCKFGTPIRQCHTTSQPGLQQ